MTDKPNPGSPDAIELGCECPIYDNHNGAGVPGQGWWINGNCPIHGNKAQSMPPKPMNDEQERLKRFIKLEIATHTQEHPEHIELSKGLFDTIEAALAQARQSERQKLVREIAKAIGYPQKEGDIGVMVIEHHGKLKPTKALEEQSE